MSEIPTWLAVAVRELGLTEADFRRYFKEYRSRPVGSSVQHVLDSMDQVVRAPHEQSCGVMGDDGAIVVNCCDDKTRFVGCYCLCPDGRFFWVCDSTYTDYDELLSRNPANGDIGNNYWRHVVSRDG